MPFTTTGNTNRLDVHPGDWYFGGEYKHIYTVLGSCVSLTAWHPRLALGGLCHFLLPEAPKNNKHATADDKKNPARYANNALSLMKQAMMYYAPMNEYQLGLFGGSTILSQRSIGQQNINYAQQWMHNEKVSAYKIDIGGNYSRSIALNILTGSIIVQHYSM